MNTLRLLPTQTDLQRAAALLNAGEVVAFPTETVYGLGASVWNEAAIKKIYTAKGRPQDNPLIVHCKDFAQVARVAKPLSPTALKLAEAFWPGPLTLILEKQPTVSDLVTAGLPTVAVRIPAHPVARQLLAGVDAPLVAPSANLSGTPSATTAEHVLHDLDGRIAAIIDGGPCPVGIESTIINGLVDPPEILRPGTLSFEALEHATGKRFTTQVDKNSIDRPRSPGLKYKHYTPKAKVHLLKTWEEVLQWIETQDKKEPCLILANTPCPTHPPTHIAPLNEQSLYAQFRAADEANVKHILVLCNETLQKHQGLLDRLQRAAT